MVRRTRIPSLSAVLLAVGFMTGCTHFRNMEACQPNGGESECWVSSGHGRRSGNDFVVVERVTADGEACDRIQLETSTFDPSSRLVQRVVEVRRCGVTEERFEYDYDFERGMVASRVERDLDHDDQMDMAAAADRPMTDSDRTLLARAVPSALVAQARRSAHN